MSHLKLAVAMAASILVSGCKIQIVVPDEGGTVTTVSGNFDCAAGASCEVDVNNDEFDETFQAVPAEGFQFVGWVRRDRGLCGGSGDDCRLPTTGFTGNSVLEALLADDDEIFFLEPEFVRFSSAGLTSLLETNANIALAAYSDSVDTAVMLKDAIDTFAADPTQANLDAAKIAWLVAREPYGQTEVYRFRLSPIDSTNYMDEDGPEGQINAWPLGEALIDYVVNAEPDFGTGQVGVVANAIGINMGGGIDGTEMPAINIIADSSIEITKELLANTATEEADEADVIAGYHAIEFLLWGQDLNDNAMVTNGDDRDQAVKTSGAPNLATGGQRPLTDFTSADGAARRLLYLQVAAEKLIEDLQGVRDGWLDGVDGNYRDQFTSFENTADAIQRLTEILTGMGTLSEGELAGERIQIAFSSNSQEDEHSCFSDNTHRDIVLNARGIANSFYGEYAGYDSDLDGIDDMTMRAVDGFGFDDYAAELAVDALTEIVGELDTRLQATASNAGNIDAAARNGQPFDVLIQDVNRTSDSPVAQTILALNAQSNLIAALAEQLAIDVQVVDDDASECDTTQPGTTCG
ncbi:MAG: imelysin family protein [Pseudomonadota bacterium]